MSELIAKPVIKNKFWVVEDSGQKIATIQAKDDGGYAYVHDEQREYFPSVKNLKLKYNIKFGTDKKVKKENITPENIGEIMLCQIPGVSSVSALAILAQFKTLPELIKSIQEDENCLNNICTTDANGKNRKISKTAIATIIKFLKV